MDTSSKTTKSHVNYSKGDTKFEIGDIFKKLRSWSEEREELQRQLSNMISSYNTSVDKSFRDLIKGFSDMEAELSFVSNERDELRTRVSNLSDEVKELTDQLLNMKSFPKEPERNLDQVSSEFASSGARF